MEFSLLVYVLFLCIASAVQVNGISVNASRVCKPGPRVTLDTDKKKCLVIGDSVSIGYTPYVQSALKEICDVYHAPWDTRDGGALDTKYAVECLQIFLNTNFQEKVFYDVIIFNFGLHDSDYNYDYPEEFTDFTTYRKDLTSIKERLLSTGSKIGYIMTTPVPFNVTSNDRVKTVNDIAGDVMSSGEHVPTADLYRWVVLVCGEPPYSSCEIAAHQPSPHYTSDGYRYLSVLVTDLFTSLLLNRTNCHKPSHIVKDMDNEIVKRDVQGGTQPCKNSKGQTVTKCPGDMTCSPMIWSETGWGCCPLRDAISCADHYHCCPAGFVCDPSCTTYRCTCHGKH